MFFNHDIIFYMKKNILVGVILIVLISLLSLYVYLYKNESFENTNIPNVSDNKKQNIDREEAFKIATQNNLNNKNILDEKYVAELNLNNDENIDFVAVYKESVLNSPEEITVFNIVEDQYSEIGRYSIPQDYKILNWNINNSNFDVNDKFTIRLEKQVKLQTFKGVMNGFEWMDIDLFIDNSGDLKITKRNYPFSNFGYGQKIELNGKRTDIVIDSGFEYYITDSFENIVLSTIDEKDIGVNNISIESMSDGINLSKIWNIYTGEYRLSVNAKGGEYDGELIASPGINFVFPEGIKEELFSMPAYIKDSYHKDGFLWIDYREGDNSPATPSEGYDTRLNIYQIENDYNNIPVNDTVVEGKFNSTNNLWSIDTSLVNKDTYRARMVGWCPHQGDFYFACARRYPLIVGLSGQISIENIISKIFNK